MKESVIAAMQNSKQFLETNFADWHRSTIFPESLSKMDKSMHFFNHF